MLACEETAKARAKEIGLCKFGLMQSMEQNARLASDLDDANRKLESPLRNPFVIFALGLVAGVLIIRK